MAAARPMPTSTKRAGLIPRCHAKLTTSRAANKAPSMAATGSQPMLTCELSNAIKRTAASAAPLVMPITSGEASGLRTMLCRMAPAIASAAPTRIASTIRGSLSCQIMNVSSLSAGLIRECPTCSGGVGKLPKQSDRAALSTSPTLNSSSVRRKRVPSALLASEGESAASVIGEPCCVVRGK